MRSSARPGSRAARSVAGSGVGDAVGEVLEQGAQCGERGPQLVADVGDQLAALAVDVGQLVGHRVERAGELPDLVARVAVTRTAWSPVAMRRAAAVISRSGEVMPTARSWVTARASAIVTGMLSQTGTPPAAPIVARTAATVTLAATSRPSLTLSERTGSRAGRVTGRPDSSA